jgi:hypothetical protein
MLKPSLSCEAVIKAIEPYPVEKIAEELKVLEQLHAE